jgi:protein involved in polysaccharide export with SLBB domain
MRLHLSRFLVQRVAAALLCVTSLHALAQASASAAASAPRTSPNADEGALDFSPVISNEPGSGARRPEAVPTVKGASAAETATPRDRRAPGPDVRTNRPPATGVREVSSDSEFQRFVAASTGRQLPLFGYSYFADGGAAYAPVDRMPVPGDYLIGAGDEIYVRGWGAVDIDYRATVDRSGLLNIPRVGSFRVAGVRAQDIESFLKERVARVFKNFSLSVTLGQLRSIQVFVVGQAAAPGTYTVSSLSTFINVVFASGGPTPSGSMRRVQLKRGDRVVSEIDIYDFIVRGSKTGDVPLAAADVVVFLPAGPRVAIQGAVDAPAIYELKPGGEMLSTVLGYGALPGAATNLREAQLERLDPSRPASPRTVVSLSLPSGDSTLLRDGDMLTMFPAEPRFANAVTLRGSVARPLRYPYSPGMRVSTLIPEREALITPDYYLRKNRQVQYTEGRGVGIGSLEGDVRNIVDEPNWEYAAIERLDPRSLSMQVIPFNLGKAVIDRDPASDLELRPGDVVTIFSLNSIIGPISRRTRLVRLEGEVGAPGVYQVQGGDSLRGLIRRAGGLTRDAYLFGVELSREETRRKQREALDDALRRLEALIASSVATQSANIGASDAATVALRRQAQIDGQRAQLARLRSLQPTGRIALELETAASKLEDLPDLMLEDGDRILVPSRPSFVFAVGAVSNGNGLLWRSGRTLRSYLDLAGIEPEADADNLFVVRADGTVVHAARRGWFNNIDGLELMPGDSVVVPGKTDRETPWNAFVRGLKDWSTILSQFGLTAAAIHTLR